MNQETEIEYKNIITLEEYDKMLNYYSKRENITSWQQSNYYFDTPDLQLKKENSALRLRTIENKKAEITLKTPYEDHLLENTINLDYNESREIVSAGQIDLPDAIERILKEMNIDSNRLKYQASMTTLRNEWHHSNCTIALDQSSYIDIKDYELEVEAPTDKIAQETFNRILEQFSIEKRETLNKIARAFQYMQQ